MKLIFLFFILFFFCTLGFAQENSSLLWELTPKEKKIQQNLQNHLTEQNYNQAKNYLIQQKLQFSKLLFYHRLYLEILFLQEKERELLDLVSQWIVEYDNDPNYFFLRAIFLYRLNYQLSAFEDFTLAYEKNQKTSEISEFLYYYYQAILHTESLQDLSYKLVEQILQLQPQNSNFLFEKAKFQIKQKKFQEAYLNLQEIVQLDPQKHYYNQLLNLEKILDPQKYSDSLIYLMNKYPKDIYYYQQYTFLQKTPLQKRIWEETLQKSIKTKKEGSYLADFYLLLAQIQSSDKQKVLENYRKAVDLNRSSRTLLPLANFLWQENQKQEAILYFEELYHKKEGNILIFYILASYYSDQNQIFSAQEVILNGLEFYKNNSTLLYLYSQILVSQGRYLDAIAIVEDLLKIEENRPDLLRSIGFWYGILKDYKTAEKYLEQALTAKEEELTYYRLANIYHQQEKNNLALSILEQDFKNPALIPFVYSLRAQIYFHQEQYQKSVQTIQKLIALKEGQGEKITEFVKNLEIQSLMFLENFALAESRIEFYQQQDTLTRFLKRQQIVLEFIRKKTEKKELLSKISNYLQQEEHDNFLLEIFYYLQQKETYLWSFRPIEKEIYQKILYHRLQESQSMIAKLPENNTKKFLNYLWQQAKGKNAFLLENTKTKSFWQNYYLAYESLQTNQLEQGVNFTKKALTQNPDFIWSYALLGSIYQHQENYKQAIVAYKKFLREFPLNLSVLKKLAISYDFSMQSNQAKRIYLKIIQNYPSEELALNNLAWLYLTKFPSEENNKKALELSKKAVQIQKNAANLDTLAEVYYQNGNYQEALKLIEKSLILDHQNLDHFKKQRVKFQKALETQENSL